jgi:hypothetical protein
MSTVTITASNFCSPGNCHCTITASGDVSQSQQFATGDLLVAPDQRDQLGFLRCLAWMAQNGRTAAQAKTLLTNGVTITV